MLELLQEFQERRREIAVREEQKNLTVPMVVEVTAILRQAQAAIAERHAKVRDGGEGSAPKRHGLDEAAQRIELAAKVGEDLRLPEGIEVGEFRPPDGTA